MDAHESSKLFYKIQDENLKIINIIDQSLNTFQRLVSKPGLVSSS